MPTSEEKQLTVAEVADIIGVLPKTVREWARSGELAGYCLSNKIGWRFSETALQQFIDARSLAHAARNAAGRASASRSATGLGVDRAKHDRSGLLQPAA